MAGRPVRPKLTIRGPDQTLLSGGSGHARGAALSSPLRRGTSIGDQHQSQTQADSIPGNCEPDNLNQSHDPAIARQVTKVEAIGADGNATDAPSGGAWRKAAELLMGTD